MISLCLDTSYKNLVIAIIKDNEVIASFNEEAFKRQSETIFVELEKVMQQANIQPDDIDEVLVTKGPGSYTGVRIAMCVAKVFCATKQKTLKTISTLKLYAGKNDVQVILDARSNRVYYGKYNNGEKIEECIKTIDELNKDDNNYVGDTYLLDKTSEPIDLVNNFLILKDEFETVDNIHTLTPEYLKSNDEYLK